MDSWYRKSGRLTMKLALPQYLRPFCHEACDESVSRNLNIVGDTQRELLSAV